jgi:hypothetical protein
MTEYEAPPGPDNPPPGVPTVMISAPGGGPLLQAARAPTLRTLAPMSLQARADRWMVRAVPEIRYRLTRLGLAGFAGLLSLAAAAILIIAVLIPARQSIQALTGQLSQASQAYPAPAARSLTPRQFAGTLPSRGQVPALLGTVLAQAGEAGVVLEQGKYTFTPAANNRLARYSFEFPVKADYANIRAFINKSLTVIPALGLDKLHIERKNVGDPTVTAEVGFVIYLKGNLNP